MNRRLFLGAAVAAGSEFSAAEPSQVRRSRLGVATTSYLSYWRPNDTVKFLEHCHKIGAAGIQAPLTSLEPAYLDGLERRLKDLGMYFELISPLPSVDMSRFMTTLEAAKKIGAVSVRSACLSGRRYETFGSLTEWKNFVAGAKAGIGRAVPAAEKLKLPIGLENHKDWTIEEFVPLLRSYSSPYLGVCLDTGNNISLLDDPYEVVQSLAPFAVTVHLKDMGVASATDGFLLSEVVFGTGMLDIGRIIDTIQKAKPGVKLNLEMITRDPLRVPVFTDKYWATFPDRNGIYLARTMRLVREKGSKLPVYSQLSKTEQLAAEEANVRKCLELMPV